MFNNFFPSKIVSWWDIVQKNILEFDRPQMTIWCTRTACWTPKTTNTHGNNGYTNAPRYVIRTLPVLFIFILTVQIFFHTKLYTTHWRNVKFLSRPKHLIFPSSCIYTEWMRMSRPNLQKVNLHHSITKNSICTYNFWSVVAEFPGRKSAEA